jgi:hypothetical protein
MLMLACYSNKLPGNEPLLTGEQANKCVFSSFPLTWQQQYIHSGQRVVTTPLAGIVIFMSNENICADAQNSTRNNEDKKKLFSTKDHNGDSFNKRKKNGKRMSNPQKQTKESHGMLKSDGECPIHGRHPLIKCFDNPNGNQKDKMAIDHLMEVEDKALEDTITPDKPMAVVVMATAMVLDNIHSKQNCWSCWMQLQSLKPKNNTTLTKLAKT